MSVPRSNPTGDPISDPTSDPAGDPGGYAERNGLHVLGGRPSLGSYVVQLWQRRHFALELARSRFRAENEADRLGVAWMVLRPLINAAAYGLIFGVVLLADSRPDDFVPFLVCGVFVFQYFAGCLADGSRSVIQNRGLVTTLHFPRAVLPISVVAQQLFSMLVMTATLCVIVVVFGQPPRVSWLLVLPAIALMTMFCLGVAFITGRLTIHVRDIANLIPFVSRMFFYMSGIFVSIPLLVSKDNPMLPVLEANPVYVYISLVRVALLGPRADVVGTDYDPLQQWGYGLGWGVVMLVVGFVFFWQAEDKYGRE